MAKEHEDKIRKCIINALCVRGYPDLTMTEVIGCLKSIWIALEDEDLVLPGMTYAAFFREAERQAMDYMETDELVDYMIDATGQ